jgi:hypothetical protein
MKSVLACSTQLFTFLLNKTKSYSRRFLEVKGLDQDRGVWCTTILNSIFPLSEVTPSLTTVFFYSTQEYSTGSSQMNWIFVKKAFANKSSCEVTFHEFFSQIF